MCSKIWLNYRLPSCGRRSRCRFCWFSWLLLLELLLLFALSDTEQTSFRPEFKPRETMSAQKLQEKKNMKEWKKSNHFCCRQIPIPTMKLYKVHHINYKRMRCSLSQKHIASRFSLCLSSFSMLLTSWVWLFNKNSFPILRIGIEYTNCESLFCYHIRSCKYF